MEAGKVGIFRVLKTRKLLKTLDAKTGKVTLNWNVSGTRDFSFRETMFTPSERERVKAARFRERLRLFLSRVRERQNIAPNPVSRIAWLQVCRRCILGCS